MAGDSAYVWTRADRAGRMLVEASRRADLRGARQLRRGPATCRLVWTASPNPTNRADDAPDSGTCPRRGSHTM